MCDEKTNAEAMEYLKRSGHLTRRQFGQLSAGLGLAMLIPEIANALQVTESDVEVVTPDGTADCFFVSPSKGDHPGVVLWPDILGLRPAFRLMARRLAESGYSVLVPNVYYREQRAPVVKEGASFGDPAIREFLMPLAGTLNPQTQVVDAKAFVAYLDSRFEVAKDRKMGTMGYCMTGSFAMRTAATLPERIGAGASFHGGRLVSDSSDSPHLLVPKMQAKFLIAIAENDDAKEPDTKRVLNEAFNEARLHAEIEVYDGALHGWCALDSAAYNEKQANRAWGRLLDLFERSLA